MIYRVRVKFTGTELAFSKLIYGLDRIEASRGVGEYVGVNKTLREWLNWGVSTFRSVNYTNVRTERLR